MSSFRTYAIPEAVVESERELHQFAGQPGPLGREQPPPTHDGDALKIAVQPPDATAAVPRCDIGCIVSYSILSSAYLGCTADCEGKLRISYAGKNRLDKYSMQLNNVHLQRNTCL